MHGDPVIFIVGTQCRPEYDQEFNTWYNETHIPLLLKFKGLNKVARYKIMNNSKGFPEYIVIYEFRTKQLFEEYLSSPERAAALEEMRSTWTKEEFEIKYQTHYELIKTWQR